MVTGIVLAGGESRRMGKPKAFLKIGGKQLIQYPLALLNSICPEVFVVSKKPELYSKFNVKGIQDEVDAGPMGGIYTGLREASYPWAIVLACDMPFVTREILEGLIRQIRPQSDLQAVIPLAPEKSGKELMKQPLCALYSKQAIPTLEKKISSGQISLIESFSEPGARFMHWLSLDPKDREAISFRNLNDPKEFKSAKKEF